MQLAKGPKRRNKKIRNTKLTRNIRVKQKGNQKLRKLKPHQRFYKLSFNDFMQKRNLRINDNNNERDIRKQKHLNLNTLK